MKTYLLLLLTAFALTGCCVAERCDCPKQALADTIGLRFDRDTLTGNGFTAGETARLLLIRRPVDTARGARTDSLFIADHRVPAAGAPDFLLSKQEPFGTSALGVGDYDYDVVVLRKPGRPNVARFTLTDVLTETRYVTTTSCCTCYQNARKEARLNGGALLNLYTPPGSDPAVVELRR